MEASDGKLEGDLVQCLIFLSKLQMISDFNLLNTELFPVYCLVQTYDLKVLSLY